MDIILTVVFIFWLFCTILAQRDKPKILKYDYLILLPICRFFSPTPVSKDISIYVQGKSENDTLEATWRPLFYTKKQPWCFIWNPELRLSKSINTLFRQLKPFMNSLESIHLSSPYLSILNVSSSLYRHRPEIVTVQFMIVAHSGFENQTREILFVSHVHNI